MKSLKIALALFALAAVTGLAYVAQQGDSGTGMVSAAEGFVGTLTADQKKQAVYDFDSDERFRWEFIPGSTLYGVWTQQRQDFSHPGDLRFRRDAAALFSAPADDVFLVKMTYWIGR